MVPLIQKIAGWFLPPKLFETDFANAFPRFQSSYLDEMKVSPSEKEFTNQGIDLKPGAYCFYLQSYCLHGGKHSPSDKTTFLIAPLKGEKSQIIKNILNNSVEQKIDSQGETQSLLWAILSGTKLEEMTKEMRVLVNRLLTPEESKTIKGGLWYSLPQSLRGFIWEMVRERLPKKITDLVDSVYALRDKVQTAQATYEEIKNVAVLSGVAPLAENMPKVSPNEWSIIPGKKHTFFMRVSSEGFSTAKVELRRLPPCKPWTKLADAYAKKRGIDPRILKATVEAESGGYNSMDDKGHAFGYGHVWPEKWTETVQTALQNAGVVIPPDKMTDYKYLGEQLLHNDKASMEAATFAVKDCWQREGDPNDFGYEHFKKFSENYVGEDILSNTEHYKEDLKRRYNLWEKWIERDGDCDDSDDDGDEPFNPPDYIFLPNNPNEQSLAPSPFFSSPF